MATTPTPPSSSLPQPLSYEDILGQELSSYAATLGINDLNVGSANVSFFQLVALMVARSSGDIFQILRDYSLDRATGPALQNLALEYNVPPIGAATATGFITVTDLSFQKIATKVYAGLNPPIAGSTTIYVSDASLFPSTGAVYIGRGSVNVEGPLAYSAKTQIGSYWSLTLSAATTKFHNISESVILSQGGVRTVPTNTIVISPGIGTTPDIQYTVTQLGTILDGDTSVSNIPVTALLPGAAGNVPANAISQFAGNPSGLSNASISNPLALTTGADTETDDQLRVRVKNTLASTGLGTVTSIESALQGVQDPSSSATIVSTDVLNDSSNTTVYVDDGTGYEATNSGVAIETIVNSALGGEKFFQLVTGGTQTSVTKAFLQTVAVSPFALFGGEVLAVIVGDVTYTHTFAATDFANPGSATAYEVCASINANTIVNFEAVTAGGGTFVVIRPEDQVTNLIQATTPASSTVTDANTILQFPSQKAETLRLYKNGLLLTQDGAVASIFTQQQSLWSSTLASGETLSLSVDGTDPITYTFTDADFVAEGTYPTLSYSNSLESWVNVFNAKITGITASIVGSTIEFTSNLGAVNRAKVTVVNTVSNPSSLIAKGVISNTDLTSTGVKSDYILDRNTAQIQLGTALVAGDSLSAGTVVTQANIKTISSPSGSLVLSSDANVWIAVDTDAILIPTIQGGSTLTVSKVATNTVRYTSNSASPFANVVPGDYVIIWSTDLPSTDRLEGRVHAATGNTLDIKVTLAEYNAATTISNAPYIEGFVVVRTAFVPQKFTVTAGTKTLYTIAAELQAQTNELFFSVFNGTNISIVTNTYATTGQITVATADAFGALIGFVGGTNSSSQEALIAFYETESYESELPLFLHSTISADAYVNKYVFTVTAANASAGAVYSNNGQNFTVASTIVSGTTLIGTGSGGAPTLSGTLTKVSGTGQASITFSSAEPVPLTAFSSSQSLAAFDPNEMISFLNPYGIVPGTLIDDEQPAKESVQTSDIVTTNVTILPEYPNVRRLRTSDRFYVANPLDFGYADTAVAIVDNNTVGETYTLPLYRRAIVNNTYPANNFSFNAYDVDTGSTASFVANFSTFDFSNFKVLLQAKYVLKAAAAQTALLYRSALWGRSGENVHVSYTYPTAANRSISSSVTSTAANAVNIQIGLISGAAIGSSTAANTQWNVSIAPNVPSAGIDQVTYNYAGQYTFTVASSSVTSGAIYSNNGQQFQVTATTVSSTTLVTNSLAGAPLASGTLTKVSGTGPSTIAFSSRVFVGYGTAPNLSLSGGEYVTILPATGFNVRNTGTFRVSTQGGYTPTTTSFSVQTPNGQALAQSDVLTSILGGINFYTATPTTAAAINTYVNANLSKFVTTTIVNDGGTSGSGIISRSTYEESGFTVQSYSLKDGINWLASSNIPGSPQFTFKRPLTYASDTGYSFFTSGDEVRFIPTTIDQVQRLWSILAVTGYTTVGTINTVERGSRLQLATNTIGSTGSIQVVGGSGNQYTVPVLTSGELLGNTKMTVSANSVASQSMASDQWFRLSAQNYQSKNTGIASNTSVTVLSNTPVSQQATIILTNQNSDQMYFGSPRHNIRVMNDTFRVEKQGSLACLSWDGVGTSPAFSAPISFNASGGGTLSVTAGGTYTILSGAANFGALAIRDLITITGMTNAANNGTFFVEGVTGNSFDVSNPLAVSETGTAYTGSTFSATTGVSEGDSIVLGSIFSPLNQGLYRAIRSNNNSVWFENDNAVEEEITCSPNTISTGYSASTVFNVIASGGIGTLSWTGAGTTPILERALPGDVVTFGSGFNSANQGSFMVVRSGPPQQQVVELHMPAGSTFVSSGPGKYFKIFNGGNANQYYVWFNVLGGSNTDPAPGGFTGIRVDINSSDSSATVASETYSAINGVIVATTCSVLDNVVTVTTTATAATNVPINVSMPVAFSFVVTQVGQEPFLSVINPAASTQSGISSVTFSINRPQIQFLPYEATVPGDKLSVSGTVLGAGNAGSYKILQVLSPNTAIVVGGISQQYYTNLAGNYTSLSVEEGTAYTGYKQVSYVVSQPGTANFNNIVFNTSAQYDKIGFSADVEMVSLGKLNFPTTIKTGIDSYIYDTGLIGQANRVIYGDPRDSVTYPGVNAAGTDIFIREPLLRRIKIALAIRTNIGISFAQITSQIQSSVYALIQSNPLGQSIDLSSIVETVRAIPGVTSVVLTNPAYTVNSDEIQLVTGEKAFIANQISDISVSLIGS